MIRKVLFFDLIRLFPGDGTGVVAQAGKTLAFSGNPDTFEMADG